MPPHVNSEKTPKPKNESSTSLSALTQERATESNAIQIPQIALPKGGGALKGIDKKFQVNAANGTASFSIPLPFSPNRNGFNPGLTLQQREHQRHRDFALRLSQEMFPYLPGNRVLSIDGFDLFFEVNRSDPADGVTVQFKVDSAFGHLVPDECDGDILEIHCVQSKEWPGLYHGKLNLNLWPIAKGKQQEIGSLRFKYELGTITALYLICGYRTK